MSDTDIAAPPAAEAQPKPRPVLKSAKAPDSGDMPKPADGGVSADDPRRPGFVRQPFSGVTLKLSAPKRAGYHRHWFNDVLDRIGEAKRAGYTHVCEEGSTRPIKRVVGTAKGGGPLTAFYMEIPKEWFEEDMAAGQKVVDEIDRAIWGDNIARKPGDNRYTPKGAIKIEEDD